MARDQLSRPRNTSMSGGGDPFLSLQREMNRMFDDVFRGFGALSPAGRGERGGAMMQPEIDVSETEQAYKICADLPGVSEKDVDVTLDNDVLTIKAERTQERNEEKENYHLVERSHGVFQRALRLPSDVDADNVEANFQNGVLTLTIPKSAGRSSRRIQVQGAGTGQRPASQEGRPAEQQQSRTSNGGGQAQQGENRPV